MLKRHWDMIINRCRVLFKSITGELNTVKAIWKLICTAVGCVSSFFSLTVFINDLTGCYKFETWVKGNWWIVGVIGLLISCIINRQKIDCCKKVSAGDMQIAISVKDIFSNWTANSFVIPTNTFFRTKMENEYISPQSVQGSFQLKYFKKNIDKLDSMITESLVKQGIDGKSDSDCFGPTIKYPIGTVAKIDYKKKHFYFVAINDVNEYGKPIGQSIENVNVALSAVTDAIRRMGHCDTLCIPLIGTGRASIQKATRENVFQKTVDQFILSNDKLVSKLIIAINPTDYLKEIINMDRIEKYLDYKCEFSETAKLMQYK